jgi:hypothetical protein
MWLEFAIGEFSYHSHTCDAFNGQCIIDVGPRDTLFPGVKNLRIQQILTPMPLVLFARVKGIWHLRARRINRKASIQMVDLVNYVVILLI